MRALRPFAGRIFLVLCSECRSLDGEKFMRRVSLVLAAVMVVVSCFGFAQAGGPYKVLQTEKVGGEGGFDYVYADDAGRKLYIPRSGPAGKITVFDLDTLKPVGEIANSSAHGAAVDTKSQHGFG